MKKVFALEEAALKTFLSNPQLMNECEQFLIQNLSTEFLNLPALIRETILDELLATRGSIIANAIINGGRYTEDQLERLEKISDRNFQDYPEFKELQKLPDELITLLLAAIQQRKTRLFKLHHFAIDFLIPYPFDVPYVLNGQNEIDLTKSMMTWLKKHLTAEDIRNNESRDFSLYQFALVTKDPDFFQWFWHLAGPGTQQNLRNFSKGEATPFFAAVEMGLLWFCELLYWQADSEQKFHLLTKDGCEAYLLAAKNNRLDVLDWIYSVTIDKEILTYTRVLCTAASAGHRTVIAKLWERATTPQLKIALLGRENFDAFREAVLSGNLEICKLLWAMATEINSENEMLMAERGTGSILNLAASRGHLHVCEWIATIASANQLPLLLQNMDVHHFPSNRSLATVALYRWMWNIASPEMRQIILTVNNGAVFKHLLEIGLIPICRILLENATEEQRDQMLLSGLVFTNHDDKFSIKAFDWAWENTSASLKEFLLDKLLVKEVDDVFTMKVLLSRNLKYGLWLCDKATPHQRQAIMGVLKEALANPNYYFGTRIHSWVAALEKSFQKPQQIDGATQASAGFFHPRKGQEDEDTGQKPTGDKAPKPPE